MYRSEFNRWTSLSSAQCFISLLVPGEGIGWAVDMLPTEIALSVAGWSVYVITTPIELRVTARAVNVLSGEIVLCVATRTVYVFVAQVVTGIHDLIFSSALITLACGAFMHKSVEAVPR